MSFLKDLSIGWDNAWWFPAAYGSITVIIIAIYRKKFVKKFFRFPSFASMKERVITMSGAFIFGRLLMVYSLFVKLKLNTICFWIGVIIFSLGMVITVIAMINFASTPEEQPVVKGVYSFSRNPVQVLAVVMWTGVGIATASWIIILVSLLLGVLYYPTFLAQERYCLEKYGAPYREYMKTTPRYLFFKENLS
jgi:protein-S-isoprenylcysteine O-methyltransferase Ste14